MMKKKRYATNPAARLLTQVEMAALLGVRRETLSRWTTRGLVPCARFGSKFLRYDPAAVSAALVASPAEKEAKR